MSPDHTDLAAMALGVIFLGISAFQLLLAVGKPYGEMAWGGRHRVLPKNLRISSGVAVVMWLFVSAVFWEISGVLGPFLGWDVIGVVLWIVTPFLALGTVMNGISRSPKERNLWTPINAVSFLLCLYILLVR